MITSDDVIAAFPHASSFDPEKLAHWCEVAEHAIPVGRVKDMRTLTVSQVLFVMHHLERPDLNLAAPHVRARMSRNGRAGAGVKAPHPWSGTEHGKRLIAAVRY